METISYISPSIVTLNDILKIAEGMGYKTQIFFELYEMLNIHFGQNPSEWWQWIQIEERELNFDDESDYEKLKEMSPKSIFAVEYHANTTPTLANFLKEVLKQYGGLVECKSGLQEPYTIENIDQMVTGCP